MNDKENPQPSKSAVHTFNAKDLGLSLREVAVDVMRKEQNEVESRWFHSLKDVDLFIWKDHRQRIIKQQVTYYGQLVEWNPIEGVRTGLIIEDETRDTRGIEGSSNGVKGSVLIRYDVEPQKHAIEQGAEIIGYVPGLAEDLRQALVSNLLGVGRGFKTPFALDLSGWLKKVLKIVGISSK